MAQEVPASSMTAVDYVLSGIPRCNSFGKIAAAEAENDYTTISALYEQYADLDGYTARSELSNCLWGWFTESSRQSLSVFSGGWRVRLNLACTLMAPCELLLLDEPTNHLDLDAILAIRLAIEFEGTLIIISHDRDFLDDAPTPPSYTTRHFTSIQATTQRSNVSVTATRRPGGILQTAASNCPHGGLYAASATKPPRRSKRELVKGH